MNLSFLTTDISGNKYFRIFLVVVIGIWLVAYLIQYNSVEKKCEREVNETASLFSSANKLQQEILNATRRQLIQECIDISKE